MVLLNDVFRVFKFRVGVSSVAIFPAFDDVVRWDKWINFIFL